MAVGAALAVASAAASSVPLRLVDVHDLDARGYSRDTPALCRYLAHSRHGVLDLLIADQLLGNVLTRALATVDLRLVRFYRAYLAQKERSCYAGQGNLIGRCSILAVPGSYPVRGAV
jgi:hypothetical protein